MIFFCFQLKYMGIRNKFHSHSGVNEPGWAEFHVALVQTRRLVFRLLEVVFQKLFNLVLLEWSSFEGKTIEISLIQEKTPRGLKLWAIIAVDWHQWLIKQMSCKGSLILVAMSASSCCKDFSLVSKYWLWLTIKIELFGD